MQTLRQARLFARLVLGWFLLALGVAVASPIVRPQSMALICSTGGAMKLVVQGADGTEPSPSHTLDCPLCGSASGIVSQSAVSLRSFSDAVLHALVLSREVVADRAAAPLPPRGPPLKTLP